MTASDTPLVSAVEAERIALAYAAAQIHVVACNGRPDGAYMASDEPLYYFLVPPQEVLHIGGSRCVGVSKITGIVRELGSVGE